jgi:predicted ATPase
VPLRQDLQARGLCREIALDFLGREDIERYLALEFPGHGFPPDLPGLIHSKTDGSPLFLVDLVRYLRDRGVIAEEQGRWAVVQSIPEIEKELPESIRSMIQRKLDQLGEEDRRLLATAAVQGHEFDTAVCARSLGMDAEAVEERLEELERVHALVRFVREQEYPDRTLTLRYRFVHALYQNVLYASLRPTRRATLSATVALALLGCFGDQSSSIASELAVLFESARDPQNASTFYLQAAQNAARLFAHREVNVLAQRGLEALKALPESPERDERELMLLLSLGVSVLCTQGHSAPEMRTIYDRARELCEQMDNSPQLFPVIWGIWAYYFARAEYRTALGWSERLLRTARDSGDPSLLIEAHRMIGGTLLHLGQLALARDHIERQVALYDRRMHEAHVILYGQDPGAFGYAYGSWVLWLLGRPDRALEYSERSVTLARELAHPFTLAFTLGFAAWFHPLRRDAQTTLKRADEALSISNEHGFLFAATLGWSFRGWALAELGRAEEGIAELRRGIACWRATGADVSMPYTLTLLAQALGRSGQIEQGLTALAEALSIVERTGELWCEPEIHRTRGELLLRQQRDVLKGDEDLVADAERSLRRAVEVAQSCEARSLELRALIDLGRLHLALGRFEETRPTLSELYGWFTEGLETDDLRAARELLGTSP